MCDRPAMRHTRSLTGFTSGTPQDSGHPREARHARLLARRGASYSDPTPHPLGPFLRTLHLRERRRPTFERFFSFQKCVPLRFEDPR